ncbi:hypothetical protein JW835_00810 [bacterium]|nr:hypothetical protein [bacterium]
MKPHFISFFLLFCSSALISAGAVSKSSMEFQAGFTYMLLGDLNQSINMLQESGLKYNEMHSGADFQIVYRHPYQKQKELLCGGGCIVAFAIPVVKIPCISETYDELGTIKMTHFLLCTDTYALIGGTRYFIKEESLKLGISSALTLHWAMFHESGSTEKICMGALCKTYDYSNTAHGFGIGGEIAMHPVIYLNPTLQLSSDIGFRYANIGHFQSDWTGKDFSLNFTGTFLRLGLCWQI